MKKCSICGFPDTDRIKSPKKHLMPWYCSFTCSIKGWRYFYLVLTIMLTVLSLFKPTLLLLTIVTSLVVIIGFKIEIEPYATKENYSTTKYRSKLEFETNPQFKIKYVKLK